MTNTYLPLGRVHIGDINTKFLLTVLEQIDPNDQSPVQLSNTTNQYMIFLQPDGITVNTFTATINAPPGNDGVIYYLNTNPAFIAQTGILKVAAKLVYTDGSTFTSNSAQFEVIGTGIGD